MCVCVCVCCTVKRADEIIFNPHDAGEASRVKKSDSVAADAAGEDAERVHDVSKRSDGAQPVSVVNDAEQTAAAADNAKTASEDVTENDRREASEGDSKQSQQPGRLAF